MVSNQLSPLNTPSTVLSIKSFSPIDNLVRRIVVLQIRTQNHGSIAAEWQNWDSNPSSLILASSLCCSPLLCRAVERLASKIMPIKLVFFLSGKPHLRLLMLIILTLVEIFLEILFWSYLGHITSFFWTPVFLFVKWGDRPSAFEGRLKFCNDQKSVWTNF